MSSTIAIIVVRLTCLACLEIQCHVHFEFHTLWNCLRFSQDIQVECELSPNDSQLFKIIKLIKDIEEFETH